VGNLLRRRHTGVEGANQDVVDLGFRQFLDLVRLEALVHRGPLLGQLADRVADQNRQVALDKGGVLAGDFDFAGESEVVTDEDARADHQASGEALVVAVAKAEDVGVVFRRLFAVGDLEHGEVALAVTSQGVLFVDNAHVESAQGLDGLVVEVTMADGVPDALGCGCANGVDGFKVGLRGTGMEDEV